MCCESQHCHCITEGSLQFSFFFFRNGLVKRLVLLNFAVPSRTEQLIFCLINLPLRVSWSLDPVYLHIFAPLRAGSSAAVLERKGVLDDTVLDKQPNPVRSPHLGRSHWLGFRAVKSTLKCTRWLIRCFRWMSRVFGLKFASKPS